MYLFISNFFLGRITVLTHHITKEFCSKQHNLQNLLLSMPKDTRTKNVQLQTQRQKLKEKGQKYVPGTVSLQVLGSGAKGAPRSLYVFTDQSRYLFNCGEGTQRLAHEHKMKLSKLEHIFITHPCWENIGGLPGVALTIQDVGVPEITLHGPDGTNEIFNATRRFVILKDLSVKMAACTANDSFEDAVMTVNYVPLSGKMTVGHTTQVPSPGRDESDDDVDYYAHERKAKKRRRSRDRSPSVSKRWRTDQGDSVVALSYICRLKPRPGTLCLERCVERGVPPGPLLGKLKAGEDVTLADGTVVKSADVRLPDDPGPVFLVVDCPSVDCVDALVSSAALARHQAAAPSQEDIAFLVVHFTPSDVMLDARYVGWTNKFPPSTHHLVLNETNTCMGSVAVHRIQHKLHLLHQGIFPLLQDRGIPEDGHQTSNGSAADVFSMTQARTLCSVHLRPLRGLDSQGGLQLHPKTFVEETHGTEGFPDALADLQRQLRDVVPDPLHNFPQVVFLGTGSCIPNKTRNTSGILVHTSEDQAVLLDCGEGTYGQLVRLYGPDHVDVVLAKLRAVFVSHLHADHHIGLVGLLKGRRRALPQHPLFLLAPRQIMSWLRLYHRCFEPVLQDFVLVANGDLDMDDRGRSTSEYAKLLAALHMSAVSTVPVTHCPNAFGVALSHRSGWKLTYSGDTMPCERLVDLGKGSDLLIHEATMEDELEGEARFKMHSTTSQAIEVGRRMGAKFTLLTHFSQRYAKLPRLNANFSQDVGIAFDNMQVRLGELPLLPLMYPALKIMFAEHYEEMEQKTARRLMRDSQAVPTL